MNIIEPELPEPLVVLTKLQDKGLTAFIAGGWARDTILGKEPKDMDVFVLNNLSTNKLDEVFDSHCTIIHNSQYLKMRDEVIALYKYDNLNLDVLLMSNPTIEYVLENFDVSICQAICVLENDKLVYKVSKDFMDYINNRIIYRYTNIPTSDDHLYRVKRKFNITDFVEKESGKVVLIDYNMG